MWVGKDFVLCFRKLRWVGTDLGLLFTLRVVSLDEITKQSRRITQQSSKHCPIYQNPKYRKTRFFRKTLYMH